MMAVVGIMTSAHRHERTYVAFSRELALCILVANPGFCTGVVDINGFFSRKGRGYRPYLLCIGRIFLTYELSHFIFVLPLLLIL